MLHVRGQGMDDKTKGSEELWAGRRLGSGPNGDLAGLMQA